MLVPVIKTTSNDIIEDAKAPDPLLQEAAKEAFNERSKALARSLAGGSMTTVKVAKKPMTSAHQVAICISDLDIALHW